MVSTQASHRANWYRNGDHSRPGHTIDFVLVNNSSVLDTRVYRSVYHESDHDLVHSVLLALKIKAKHHQPRAPL